MRGSVVLSCALLFAAGRTGFGQDVVSASSGLLQYFEGAVVLDGKAVEHKAAVFAALKNGSILHTEKGRAELLLTPGVYLRMDENSSLKMVSNSLSDTRVQLTGGSAIFDNLNAGPDSAVVLLYDAAEVRFPKPGVYRIDCDLAELQAYSGESKITQHGVDTTIDSAHRYYFALEMSTSKFGDGDTDEFYDWADNRSDTIANENQIASAEQDDAQNADPGAAGVFVAPPPPTYADPSAAYSSIATAIDPFYLYSPVPNFGYAPFASILVVPVFRHRGGGGGSGSKWPVSSGGVYRFPAPVVTRWPTSTHGVLSHYPTPGIRYPITQSLARPTVTIAPRATSPAISIPRTSLPHAVGHR